MKKSSQSLKNIKKSKPNKKLTGKNFEVHKHTSNIEDPEIMAAMIDLAMRDSDLKRETKNFSLEYVEILKGRLRLYFKNFHTTRSVGSDFPDKWEENINRGLFKEIEFLKNEQLAFDEKHKVSLEDSIKKAKKGESRSILRLVKWDKGWAAQDFIQNIIIERQATGDQEFFKDLGDAISQIPGCMKAIRQHHRLLEHIKLISLQNDLTSPKIRKQLHAHLDKQGYFSGDKEITPLADFDYFTKWLRRKKIIT